MPNQPLITATCKVTAEDINGNNVLKTFSNVLNLNFDYNTGRVNVVDVTGSFYFNLYDITALTYAIAGSADGGAVAVVMS